MLKTYGTKEQLSPDGGAAMIVEEIENSKHYRCNDEHLDENFDDIGISTIATPSVALSTMFSTEA